MTKNRKFTSKVEFSDEDLRQLADILEIKAFDDAQTGDLQKAATHYVEIEWGEFKFWPNRAEQRRAFQRVAEDARNLIEALSEPALFCHEGGEELAATYTAPLSELAERANKVAEAIPKTGAEPKTARKMFVDDLARVFEEVTGRRPTLSRKLDGQPSGMFFNFVYAAVGALHQHATQGIEADIRKSIEKFAP